MSFRFLTCATLADFALCAQEQTHALRRPMLRSGRWAGWLVWLIVLATLISGCGRPAPQPLRFQPAPWAAGEVSEYAVTDLNGQSAGIARYAIEIGTGPSNSDGWSIRREIAAQGVNEVLDVEMTADYRPLTSLMVRTAGQRQQQETVRATYNRGQVDLELTTVQNVTTYERANIPSDARESNVLLMIVRGLPLAEGYATRINTYLPIAGLLETFTVSVLDTEVVTVPAGVFDTYKVELRTRDYTTLAWYSQDESRVLVKYEDGRNQGSFELTNWTAGSLAAVREWTNLWDYASIALPGL
jgi:hypothetical protein